MEVRKVTKAKDRGYTEKRQIRIDHFGNANTIRNNFARAVNVLSGSDMCKITVGELRAVWKQYNSEWEAEVTQNELTELGNWKEATNKEEKKK